MKSTDMSKLHLAKRVEQRNGESFEVLLVIKHDKLNRFEIKMKNDLCEVTSKYELDGKCRTGDSQHDIIAFDIDEPLSEERSEYIEKISREAMSRIQQQLKPHKLAQLTNELRDIAIKYHNTQQLREVISNKLKEYLK